MLQTRNPAITSPMLQTRNPAITSPMLYRYTILYLFIFLIISIFFAALSYP